MKHGFFYTIEDLRKRNLIIFEARMGSHAYGTSLPTSDIDLRGVFIQPLEDILKYGHIEQVADKLNDIIYYELRRFLDLIEANNPNIIEILYAPEDVTSIKHEYFELIEKHKEKFLTKRCRHTFAGYAIDQIKKARGYNKKMNWEESQMVRKGVLEFCYVLLNGGTITLNQHLKTLNSKRIDKIDL